MRKWITALTFSLSIPVAIALASGACSDDTSVVAVDDAAVDVAHTDATSDAATDAANDASGPPLGSGPYAMIYVTSPMGIDGRDVTTTFNGFELQSYKASADEDLQMGSAQSVDVGGHGPLAWGRWTNGQIAGKYYALSPLPTYGANAGFHWAVGEPTKPLPATGVAARSLYAYTQPTIGDGSLTPGTVQGSANVAFAGDQTKVGFTATVVMPADTTYTIETMGGTANPTLSELTGDAEGRIIQSGQIGITAPGSAACGGASCQVILRGFFNGPAAEHVMIAFTIMTGNGGDPKAVQGILVFAP